MSGKLDSKFKSLGKAHDIERRLDILRDDLTDINTLTVNNVEHFDKTEMNDALRQYVFLLRSNIKFTALPQINANLNSNLNRIRMASKVLNSVKEYMTQCRDLCTKASDETLTASQRNNAQIEIAALVKKALLVQRAATFNSMPIFDLGPFTLEKNPDSVDPIANPSKFTPLEKKWKAQIGFDSTSTYDYVIPAWGEVLKNTLWRAPSTALKFWLTDEVGFENEGKAILDRYGNYIFSDYLDWASNILVFYNHYSDGKTGLQGTFPLSVEKFENGSDAGIIIALAARIAFGMNIKKPGDLTGLTYNKIDDWEWSKTDMSSKENIWDDPGSNVPLLNNVKITTNTMVGKGDDVGNTSSLKKTLSLGTSDGTLKKGDMLLATGTIKSSTPQGDTFNWVDNLMGSETLTVSGVGTTGLSFIYGQNTSKKNIPITSDSLSKLPKFYSNTAKSKILGTRNVNQYESVSPWKVKYLIKKDGDGNMFRYRVFENGIRTKAIRAVSVFRVDDQQNNIELNAVDPKMQLVGVRYSSTYSNTKVSNNYVSLAGEAEEPGIRDVQLKWNPLFSYSYWHKKRSEDTWSPSPKHPSLYKSVIEDQYSQNRYGQGLGQLKIEGFVVTGSGTNFLDYSPGDIITPWYYDGCPPASITRDPSAVIASIQSATELTLTTSYSGNVPNYQYFTTDKYHVYTGGSNAENYTGVPVANPAVDPARAPYENGTLHTWGIWDQSNVANYYQITPWKVDPNTGLAPTQNPFSIVDFKLMDGDILELDMTYPFYRLEVTKANFYDGTPETVVGKIGFSGTTVHGTHGWEAGSGSNSDFTRGALENAREYGGKIYVKGLDLLGSGNLDEDIKGGSSSISVDASGKYKWSGYHIIQHNTYNRNIEVRPQNYKAVGNPQWVSPPVLEYSQGCQSGYAAYAGKSMDHLWTQPSKYVTQESSGGPKVNIPGICSLDWDDSLKRGDYCLTYLQADSTWYIGEITADPTPLNGGLASGTYNVNLIADQTSDPGNNTQGSANKNTGVYPRGPVRHGPGQDPSVTSGGALNGVTSKLYKVYTNVNVKAGDSVVAQWASSLAAVNPGGQNNAADNDWYTAIVDKVNGFGTLATYDITWINSGGITGPGTDTIQLKTQFTMIYVNKKNDVIHTDPITGEGYFKITDNDYKMRVGDVFILANMDHPWFTDNSQFTLESNAINNTYSNSFLPHEDGGDGKLLSSYAHPLMENRTASLSFDQKNNGYTGKDSEIKVADNVTALWTDGQYYPGALITRIVYQNEAESGKPDPAKEPLYNIEWEDGSTRTNVPSSEIQKTATEVNNAGYAILDNAPYDYFIPKQYTLDHINPAPRNLTMRPMLYGSSCEFGLPQVTQTCISVEHPTDYQAPAGKTLISLRPIPEYYINNAEAITYTHPVNPNPQISVYPLIPRYQGDGLIREIGRTATAPNFSSTYSLIGDANQDLWGNPQNYANAKQRPMDAPKGTQLASALDGVQKVDIANYVWHNTTDRIRVSDPTGIMPGYILVLIETPATKRGQFTIKNSLGNIENVLHPNWESNKVDIVSNIVVKEIDTRGIITLSSKIPHCYNKTLTFLPNPKYWTGAKIESVVGTNITLDREIDLPNNTTVQNGTPLLFSKATPSYVNMITFKWNKLFNPPGNANNKLVFTQWDLPGLVYNGYNGLLGDNGTDPIVEPTNKAIEKLYDILNQTVTISSLLGNQKLQSDSFTKKIKSTMVNFFFVDFFNYNGSIGGVMNLYDTNEKTEIKPNVGMFAVNGQIPEKSIQLFQRQEAYLTDLLEDLQATFDYINKQKIVIEEDHDATQTSLQEQKEIAKDLIETEIRTLSEELEYNIIRATHRND